MSSEICTVQELCIFLGGSEKLLIELQDRLRDWLKLQPHLPQDFSEKKLAWFILRTKFSLETAKQKLDTYYTIRSLVPELFTDRDPRKFAFALKPWQIVILPNLTPDKHRLAVCRLTDPDPSLFSPSEGVKYMCMSADILINECDLAYGGHVVVDLSMTCLSHLLKITPVDVKKWEIIFRKAYALRVKGIHIINVQPYLDHSITMVKSVISKKISEKIHAYRVDDLESLCQFIPRSALPKDYGGEQPTMDELAAGWNAKVEEWRDWFLEQENVLVNERLRPGPALDKDSLFGFSGSFRKLDLD